MFDYIIDFDAFTLKNALWRNLKVAATVVILSAITCLIAISLPTDREYHLLDEFVGYWPIQFLPWLLAYCLLTVPLASTTSGLGKYGRPFNFISSFCLSLVFDAFSALIALLTTLTIVGLLDGAGWDVDKKAALLIIGMFCFQSTVVQLGQYQSGDKLTKPLPRIFRVLMDASSFAMAVYCIRYTAM